jgi:cell division protein FtsL
MAEVDLLLKLFDTLKDSSKDTQQMCQAILSNQTNISHYIKNLPLGDLKDLLKEHAKASGDDINTCTETVESQSDGILKEIKTLRGKVKIMITVVIVAFSLFSIASLIGIITYQTRKDVQPQPGEFYEYQDREDEHEALKKEIIDAIREEFRDSQDKNPKLKNGTN